LLRGVVSAFFLSLGHSTFAALIRSGNTLVRRSQVESEASWPTPREMRARTNFLAIFFFAVRESGVGSRKKMAAAARGGDDAPKQSGLLAAEAAAVVLKRAGVDATVEAAVVGGPAGIGAGNVVEAVDAAEGTAGVGGATGVVAVVRAEHIGEVVDGDKGVGVAATAGTRADAGARPIAASFSSTYCLSSAIL